MSAMYLCIVNLRGPMKPKRLYVHWNAQNRCADYWDRSRNWKWEGGKRTVGYAEWLFRSKAEADAWYAGAKAVCDQLRAWAK